MTALAIVTGNLTKTCGANRGIRDITLTIPEGEIFGFLGPNGAGHAPALAVIRNPFEPLREPTRSAAPVAAPSMAGTGPALRMVCRTIELITRIRYEVLTASHILSDHDGGGKRRAGTLRRRAARDPFGQSRHLQVRYPARD